MLCYPLFVLPASALLLDLSISLLGYEALFCWICVSAARVDIFVIPVAAPDRRPPELRTAVVVGSVSRREVEKCSRGVRARS